MRRAAKGAVAAGHPATAEAAVEVLAEGGNAFDAALAGLCAACVAEPVLASLGGGGFLMARPAEAPPVLYDFFTQTPKAFRERGETDFRAVTADFGTATQDFHVGLGAMATPGVAAGLFAVNRDLGRLPLVRIVEPACRLARRGVAVNSLQAYIGAIVAPIYADLPAYRAARFILPELAASLEALAREGPELFYGGAMGARLIADCRERGGHLSQADLADYRVERRVPLRVKHRGAELELNPPPSFGGILIAFALELLTETDLGAWGSIGHVETLARTMAATNRARVESRLLDRDPEAAASLLHPDLVARYRREAMGVPPATRGTTQIGVIDREGNAASLTVSNGEGTGYAIPGTGIMMNNMLGEEDINPHGFFAWPTDRRMGSMMAPSLLTEGDGTLSVLGSGGSNRIRTAIVQVLINRLAFALPMAEAIGRPRLHVEGDVLNLENGLADDVLTALRARYPDRRLWEGRNLFFGGVHVASRDGEGRFAAAGDPRRGGVGMTL